MNRILAYTVILLLLLPATVVVYRLQAAHSLPGKLYLPKTGHRKPRILFDHKAHVEKYNTECIDCHHKGTNKPCSACHEKKDKGAVVNLKGAFHQQCHDCHRKTAGPKGCGRCHTNHNGK
ncbi:MAG: cytochrome c3 family protein [bacterium]|nr:cytochrome c3 family protein [bacterium]